MPINMPKEALITVQRRELSSDFSMPQMEMAESHFSLGFLISGDRRIITPDRQFDIHAGNFMLMPPGLYHRTFSISDSPYVNYLIKISEALAESFCREVDAEVWRAVFDQTCFALGAEDTGKAEELMADMLEIYDAGQKYSEALLKGELYRLIILLWEKNTMGDALRFRDRLSTEIMEAMYYVEQNYAEDLRLRDVAAAVGFSEGHLSRLFSAQVGVPFSEYLVNVRLRHARELLLNTDQSVSEIALATGFSNGDYLSSCFRRREGLTPST